MREKLVGILTLLIISIGVLFFLEPEVQIEWTTYLGIPLVILAGSAGVAFISKRFEAIIGGMIISALWPALIEVIKLI